jgi:hypothetical protein
MMKLKSMLKKNIFLIVTIGLLVITTAIAGKSLISNADLKAAITETHDSANERIEKLEKQLTKFSQKAETETTIPKKDVQMMSEEELLSDYFTETPTLIHSTEDEVSEIDNTDSSTTAEVTTGPILEVMPEEFDLGTISKQGGVVKANYELKNAGNSDLKITYAFTSCGCTVAPLKEEVVLAPGESYDLEVDYDPNFYGAGYELGSVEKTITILSNYSKNSFYKIKLKANVTP